MNLVGSSQIICPLLITSLPYLRIFLFQGWKLYDSGPKCVKVPLVCLPPVSGTSDVFFKQILALSAKGIRVIAVRKFYTTLTLTCPSIFYVVDRLFTFSIVRKVIFL